MAITWWPQGHKYLPPRTKRAHYERPCRRSLLRLGFKQSCVGPRCHTQRVQNDPSCDHSWCIECLKQAPGVQIVLFLFYTEYLTMCRVEYLNMSRACVCVCIYAGVDRKQ